MLYHLYYKDRSCNRVFWNHFASTKTLEDACIVRAQTQETEGDIMIVYSENDMSTTLFKELTADDWYEDLDGEVRLA